MNLNELGSTGIKVSRLCFGTLAVSPLQKRIAPQKASDLFNYAFQLGINFFDTAELYDTYESLSLTLRKHPDLVIASRSYAVTREDMRQSVEKARRVLNRDYIDVFGLHEIESGATLKGHREALDYLVEAKQKGLIKAIGVSTHTIAGVRAGASEAVIDVIHPLINHHGLGIQGGGVDEMIAAIRTAKEFGKGIYGMKILAGGHLLSEASKAFEFINNFQDIIDSVAVGIQSVAEIELNRLLILGQKPPSELLKQVARIKRRLHVAFWCRGCGECIRRCDFDALHLKDGKIHVRQNRCMRCGYCVQVCPDFCLKIV